MDLTDYGRRAFAVLKLDGPKADELDVSPEALKAAKGKKAKIKDDDEENNVKDTALHYAEFFAALYNYCTMQPDTLVKFTFEVIDEDGSGEISRQELFEMVRMMHSNQGPDQLKAQVG